MTQPRTAALLVTLLATGCGEPTDPMIPPVPAAEVDISAPASASTLLVGETAQITAAVLDSSGDTLTDRTVEWSSSHPGVAAVDAQGLVTAVGLGSAVIAGTSEGKVDTATVTVGAVFNRIAVSDGSVHTCATTTADEVYCWGINGMGQLGLGTFETPNQEVPARVPNQLATALYLGSEHTCISTPASTVSCWGRSLDGQLGAGAPPASSTLCGFISCNTIPITVSGNQVFSSVAAGSAHMCGLTGAGSAFCWGWNDFGQVGNNDAGFNAGTPQPVSGPGFLTIDAGTWNSCAIAPGGALYCWGYNETGGVGDSSMSRRDVPTPVYGGLSFAKVSVGFRFSCGITAAGDAYCWGINDFKQLGIGSVPSETCLTFGVSVDCTITPQPVAGGLSFVEISAGTYHACGIVAGGQAHCWGLNQNGSTGTGLPGAFLDTPAPVTGGHIFTSISAGNEYTCGIASETTARGNTVAYCWGWNGYGQLGRISGNALAPQKVAFQF